MENYTFTPEDVQTVYELLASVYHSPYSEMNKYIGSVTLEKSETLFLKMHKQHLDEDMPWADCDD